MLPCLVFEDEHLLVVNKPPGLNTHSPSPYAGEGIYDWLRHREPRWSSLAIVHRLDKQTSGLLVFSKTPLANRSLTQQFTNRAIGKEYVFLTDRPIPEKEVLAKSLLVRAGEKYVSRPAAKRGEGEAITRFSPRPHHALSRPGIQWLSAEPLTGKTHQIRVHAADHGFPIFGDVLYGGTAASRVFLHSARLKIRHPDSNKVMTFEAPPDFDLNPGIALRTALIDPSGTTVWRVCHGASDGWRGWYLDRVGDFLLSQSDHVPSTSEMDSLAHWQKLSGTGGVSHKIWSRKAQRKSADENSPKQILGQPMPGQIIIRENGVRFELSFSEGYSIGLFFDQRDNRRRILNNHIAAIHMHGGATKRPSERDLRAIVHFNRRTVFQSDDRTRILRRVGARVLVHEPCQQILVE